MPALDPKLDIVFQHLLAVAKSRDTLTALLTAVLDPPSPIKRVEVQELEADVTSSKDLVLDVHVLHSNGAGEQVELRCTQRAGFRRRCLLEWAGFFERRFQPEERSRGFVPFIPIVFTTQRELETPRLHQMFRLLEEHDDTRLTDDFALHLIEVPKVEEEDAANRARPAVRAWARFLAARSDEERKLAALEDEFVGRANDALIELSRDGSMRKLARSREMALKAHDFELLEAREEAKEEGVARGRAEAVIQVLNARGFEVSAALRERILFCTDRSKLDRMLQRALAIQPSDEPFAV